ncbi:MAG: hypothetical protein GY794_08600, partial [bacterium]|nr:hypothetical protein [bacterium]
LTESERKVEIGEGGDLFEVDDFGEGFNIAPSIGLVKKFGAVILGGNFAYLFRGEYDPSADTPDDNLDPGDQALLLGTLQWQASRRFSLNGLLAYSHFTEDKIDGEELFQEGDTFTFGLNALYTYKRWSTRASFQQVFQGKNKELNLDEELVTESDNSNGTQSFGLLELLYRYTDTLTFRILGDLRYYGES